MTIFSANWPKIITIMFYASSNGSTSRLVASHSKIKSSRDRLFDFEFWPHAFEKQKF